MDIFLGYDHSDRDCAERVAEALDAQGWEIFWDVDIPAGSYWRTFIRGKLKEARCIVVLWSKRSVKSEYVTEEAEAGKKEKKLVPVLIDDANLPYGFEGIQFANLVNWSGDPTDQPFLRLLKDIKAKIGESPALENAADPVLDIRKDFRVRMTEAIAIYYEDKLSDDRLFVPEGLSILTRRDWLPEQPLEVKELDARLIWDDQHHHGPSHVSQFSLSSLMKNHDEEGKLHDGFLYRYLGGNEKQYKFCSSSYYKFLNSCEYLSYELAKAFKDNQYLYELLKKGGRTELEEIARTLQEKEELIPLRAKANPSDFAARITAFGTCAIVVLKRPKKTARFIINVRSRKLSETPSLLHVIPAGTFQPNARDDRFHDNEFLFTENIIREFIEELLEDKLLRGDAPNVLNFIDMYPDKGKDFRKNIIDSDNFEMLYLGTVIDPINLKPEILTVFMMHEAYFKLIAGEQLMYSWETHHNEQTKHKEIMYYDFTINKLESLINEENFVPTGKAHLRVTLKHYDSLISKLKEL